MDRALKMHSGFDDYQQFHDGHHGCRERTSLSRVRDGTEVVFTQIVFSLLLPEPSLPPAYSQSI